MNKTYKLALMAGVGMLGTVSFCGNAFAFHDGGVAKCDGCHTMHNSSNNEQMTVGSAGTIGVGVNPELTKGSDPSSTCLNCHQGTAGGYHVLSTNPTAIDQTHTNPGGDFYWLSTNVDLGRGASLADNHGHNVIAADFGLAEDAVLGTAPARTAVTYDAGELGCNSCHDPHGKQDNNVNSAPIEGSGSKGLATTVAGAVMGNFRILGGLGYDGGKQSTGSTPFTAGSPVAVSATGKEIASSHTDYGSGMSEWCANCHGGFTATTTTGNHRHPAGAGATLGAGIVANYNAYKATGDMTGVVATGLDLLVPIERNGANVDADRDGVPDAGSTIAINSTVGADGDSTVMCLTCHRAHASAFGNMGRWEFSNTLIIEEAANAIADGFTLQMMHNGDPMTRFPELQRSLCNKCHVQD